MSLTPFAMDPASSASRLSVSTLIFLPDSQETPKRTPDLLHAMQALSQLSYTPEVFYIKPECVRRVLKMDHKRLRTFGVTCHGLPAELSLRVTCRQTESKSRLALFGFDK